MASCRVTKISRVATGTLYEEACLRFLAGHLRMPLRRVGGANDNGVDLMGSWQLDDGRLASYDCVAQCKHYKKKLGPSVVRELEGTLSYFNPSTDREIPLLGLLLSRSPFTVKTIERATASQSPLWLLHLDNSDSDSDSASDGGGDTGNELVCRGSFQNPVLRRTMGDSMQTHWKHLLSRPRSPPQASFHYKGHLISSMRKV